MAEKLLLYGEKVIDLSDKLNTKLIKSFISLILLFVFTSWIFQILLLNKSYTWFRKNDIKRAFNQISNIKNSEKIKSIGEKFDSYIFIYDENKNLIYESYNMMPRGVEKEITNIIAVSDFKDIDEDLLISKNEFKYNLYGKTKEKNYILLVSKIEPIESSISIIKRQLIYIVIISLIIAIIISIKLARKISSPLKKINEKTKQLGKGNFNIKFDENSYLEVKELSATLNNTVQQLKEKDVLQKEIISNVSHDLKTPLTIIKGYAEVIRDTKQNKKDRETKLNSIINESDNLNILINNILDVSKLEADLYLNKIKIDISNIVEKVLTRIKKIVDDKNVIIIFNKKELIYSVDKNKFEQVIYNLLINAINHVGKDKTIIINILDNKLEIIDHGNGIDNTMHIFDKFYTTHNNKNSNGLGLYIVKTILEKHNLEYGVKSIKNTYTNFWIKF